MRVCVETIFLIRDNFGAFAFCFVTLYFCLEKVVLIPKYAQREKGDDTTCDDSRNMSTHLTEL